MNEIETASCRVVENDLKKAVQALTDAQALLEDCRRHGHVDPDLLEQERKHLIARLRDAYGMGRYPWLEHEQTI